MAKEEELVIGIKSILDMNIEDIYKIEFIEHVIDEFRKDKDKEKYSDIYTEFELELLKE